MVETLGFPSQGTDFDLIGVGEKRDWSRLYLALFKIFVFIIILVKSLYYLSD